MPIAAAAVDGDHGKRRQPRVDGLGQPLFDAAGHHGRRVTALAVQRDHRSQRLGLARRACDGPVGVRSHRAPPTRRNRSPWSAPAEPAGPAPRRARRGGASGSLGAGRRHRHGLRCSGLEQDVERICADRARRRAGTEAAAGHGGSSRACGPSCHGRLAEMACSTTLTGTMATRDGSSHSQGRTSTVCARERRRRAACRRRLRGGASPRGRSAGRTAVGVHHLLLLVSRRFDRTRRRTHRDDRGRAAAGAGQRPVPAASRTRDHRRGVGRPARRRRVRVRDSAIS